jgi:hypothetical protein
VIAAVTGDTRADAGVARTVRAVCLEHGGTPNLEPPTAATSVLHASDADDEVRCVVRRIMAMLGSTPAHRVAVLYGAANPYARLVGEHLADAGIEWNGAAVRPTIERTLGRLLIDLLTLPDHDWRRDEVLAVVAAAPVRDADGHRVPASRWDRISRAAGVVSGAHSRA